VLRRNLADPARRAEVGRARELWERLGEMAPTDAAADGLITELASLPGLTPGEVPLEVRDLHTRGAQARAAAELAGAW